MAPVLTHQNPVSDHEFTYSNDDKISLRNFSQVATMNLENKNVEVIGVLLADDRLIGKTVGSTDSRSVVLGTVCVENVTMNLDELRRVMCADLPCLPSSFNFLSRDGWPIHRLQEFKAKASHVISDNKCICIKKEFEKSRVGVVTSAGDAIGFVFTDLDVNIKQLREILEQQLKVSEQLTREYRFVERNGWPVMSNQETILSLVDILLGQIVCIQNCDSAYKTVCRIAERPTSLITPTNTNPAIENQLPSPTDNEVKRKRSIRFFRPEVLQSQSVKVRKESEKRTKITKDSLVSPILISYVRAEAATYALNLKQELVSMGFSVYLDVHEIKTGSDWQDALNFAVTNCFLFVPLITPMYGKTQWTNREVKLADVLGKKIIPVNFMENWPPACLAIQFASTQYIPWKLQESEHAVKGDLEKTSDSRTWDPVCLKNVASKIAECYNYRSPKDKEVVTPQSSKPMLSSIRDDYYMVPKDEYEHSQKIVISAHPRQKYLAQDLKAIFEKDGHEVWCSVELFEAQNNLYSEEITDANSPRMPTIQEGDVFFSQNEEICNSVFEKKSLSLNKEPEAYGRRPLSRLMSQLSDISHPSTLSQEKLDRLKTFQQKVDQAAVVIVLVSEAYTKSTFSHQQVFYCEHRKRVVLVRCDNSPIPKWFRLLMGNDMIMKVNNSQFECVLKARVKRAVNPSSSETPKDATSEAKMNYLVNFLKRNLPFQEICVYIAGSSKFQNPRAEEICRAIGIELAKIHKLSLVTGGFYGAADITAKTFYEYRENNAQFNTDECSVVHILPIQDKEDLTAKARQNPDGSFEAIPYGKTFFLGDSVKERETVVARLLDTCIVIEGGPGVVHEVEEFIWNDHFVIPIISTGGAAGGMYGVPVRIFELPPGVELDDWLVLSQKDASPERIAKAVVNIIMSLKRAMSSPVNTLPKSKAILKRRSRKKLKNRRSKILDDDMHELNILPGPESNKIPATMHGVFEIREASEISQSSSDESKLKIKKRYSWWRRFVNALKHRN